jgi:L-ribulokinase
MSTTTSPLAIGIDYGTLSARVLILDLADGEELAIFEVPYPHGVMEETLPGGSERLGQDWALQHPADYVEVVERGVPAALKAAGVDPARVIGLGVDFTCCTVLPALADGTPLCLTDRFRLRPHAWCKLWKHHAAQAQADRLTEVATLRGESFLARYGGKISSEWYFPKLLQIYEEDREVYDAAPVFIEALDWIVWQLTGVETRATCSAAYKALWSPDSGLPSPEYFEALAPGFSSAVSRLGTRLEPLGTRAGTLRPEIAQRIGLPASVAVAVGNVDSFVSVPGVGVDRPGAFVTVVGTSICDMIVDKHEVLVPGITGVVRDGILPGMYGYEAGQPAVGDMFGWWVDEVLSWSPAGVAGDQESQGRANGTGHADLEAAAGQLRPGESGLVALDWWNGNRSILADASLSGVIAGLTLQSKPVDIYRSLLESIAFGARRIVDNFDDNGLAISEIVACGGIAEKSPVLMQLFADVTGRPVTVPTSVQIPARGAAIFGAVAAGAQAGGFDDVVSAAAALAPAVAHSYAPNGDAKDVYDRVYSVYLALHDMLGVEHVELLRTLKRLSGTA